jgi:hypothetical protein
MNIIITIYTPNLKKRNISLRCGLHITIRTIMSKIIVCADTARKTLSKEHDIRLSDNDKCLAGLDLAVIFNFIYFHKFSMIHTIFLSDFI